MNLVLQVRHPNYLGELLVQWSWVLPAAPTLGLTQLVPYYLPVVTTLMLVLRCVSFSPFLHVISLMISFYQVSADQQEKREEVW